ncbi:DUF1080 domain-containing protein [Roseibacillus persicicus]|uniref:3-keto-disaccharide hydrolase n=1 Tax=Roseibacillus persicicus TaxID=454148 RepID=UPI00398B1D92
MNTPSDFILSLDYRAATGGNGGLFLRSSTTGPPWVTGLEVQITNEDRLPIHSTGSIYNRIPAEPTADERPNNWHHLEIAYKGDSLLVCVDGVTIVSEPDLTTTYPAITWPSDGVLGLQNEHSAANGSIEFRNIRLLSLD